MKAIFLAQPLLCPMCKNMLIPISEFKENGEVDYHFAHPFNAGCENSDKRYIPPIMEIEEQ